MALPTLFANATVATGAQLDGNFAAVGAIGVIPCTAVGTNTLALTPNANTPAVGAYANYARFSFVAVNSCSGAVTAAIGSLPALNVYKNSASGPAALVSGDIIDENAYTLVYDSALNSGTGGFHIDSASTTAAGTVTSVGLSLPASLFAVTGSPITGTGTLAGAFTTIATLSLLGNATGGAAIPSIVGFSAFMDAVLGSTQGDVAYRGSAAWAALAPGSKGQSLVTGGASANPQFGATQALGIAAAGTAQSNATALAAQYNEVTNVASGTGVIIQAVIKMPITVFARGANALLVYPPSGASIDGLSANTPVTLATLTYGSWYGVSATQYYTAT